MTGLSLLAVAGSAALVAIAAVFAWIARADRRRSEALNQDTLERFEAAVADRRIARAMREDTARWISESNPQFWGDPWGDQ